MIKNKLIIFNEKYLHWKTTNWYIMYEIDLKLCVLDLTCTIVYIFVEKCLSDALCARLIEIWFQACSMKGFLKYQF